MITQDDLRSAGFVQQPKTVNDHTFMTDTFIMSGWTPAPVVEWTDDARTQVAHIGGMQVRLTSQEVFQRFLEKTVPIFCELK